MTVYRTEKDDTRSHGRCLGSFGIVVLSQWLKVTVAFRITASGVRSLFGTNLRSVDGGVKPGHYIFNECSVRDHIANCSTKTDLYGTSVHTRIRRGRKTDKGDDKTDIGQNIPAHMYIGIQQNQRNANRDGTGLAACAPWSAMAIGIGITEPRSKDGLFACILTRTCSSTTAILDICAR